MKEKINIAGILKDKPQGTKLYSILSDGECFLNEASEDSIYIDIDNRKRFWCFTVYGSTHSFPNGCVLLFPSREMRDWSKFSWKKGDVLVSEDNVHIIFEKFEDDAYTRFKGKHYLWKEYDEEDYSKEETKMLTSVFEKANDAAAQTYINTIEERLGGKLNRETLEVEKPQPEFKDGDVVAVDEIPFDIYSKCIFILKENLNTGEIKARAYVLYNVDKNSIFFDTPVTKVIERNIHLATDEEKQRLFDALAKEGKAWDAKKKMIVDLNPNVDELKPFDKVWVKDNPYGSWEPALFWKKVDAIDLHPYMVIGGKRYRFCIPYKGNEHLLGTTNNVEG